MARPPKYEEWLTDEGLSIIEGLARQGLTDEQIAKIKSFKTNAEVLAYAKEEGLELTDEQLEAVSGGCITWSRPTPCPECKSTNTEWVWTRRPHHYHCNNCGKDFT